MECGKTVLKAMLKGNVIISDFCDENVNDCAVLDMAARGGARFDPEYNVNPSGGAFPGAIEVVTKDGQVYSRQQKRAYGHPDKPMSWDDLIAKFRDCASYAARRLPKRRIDRAIHMLMDLEQVDDVGKIFALLG